MLNLAPIRYARVLSRHNGPIEKIEYSRTEICGRALYQATATLSGRLNLERGGNAVFGSADGTGTHSSAMVARHKAISEAMERWALYYLRQSGLDADYGMREDPSSTGMSAFPGLWETQARSRAHCEAAERYCLIAWWEGLLATIPFKAPDRDIAARRIENPLTGHAVILTWKKLKRGFTAYGFGAARKAKDAYWQSVIEMERAVVALSRYYLDNPGFEADDLVTVANHLERRVLFYSLPEGHGEFMERVKASENRKTETRAVKPLLDRKVDGPWNRYATVWRVLYPMPSRQYLNGHENVFYW